MYMIESRNLIVSIRIPIDRPCFLYKISSRGYDPLDPVVIGFRNRRHRPDRAGTRHDNICRQDRGSYSGQAR